MNTHQYPISFADFNQKQNDFIDKLCTKMNKWKEEVRMDNTPKNFKFIQIANEQKWKLNLTKEATSAAIPQRNSFLEKTQPIMPG